MQNASVPQKAGQGGARRMLRAASFLALPVAAATPASAQVDGFGGPLLEGAGAPIDQPMPAWLLEGHESPEVDAFIAASAYTNWIPAAQTGWSPAAQQAPPARPLGARNSEAAPDESAADADAGFGPFTRVTDLLATPRDQLLASIIFPAFVPVDGDTGSAGTVGLTGGLAGGLARGPAGGPAGELAPTPAPEPGPVLPPDPVPAPPNLVFGESAGGMIATLTVTRRVAPSWVVDAVADDPLSVQFVAATTAGLPAEGDTRQVSIAWADFDGDGTRDGHLYRIDNANDLAVTLQARIVGGALLSGSATVAGDSAAFVWLPLSGPATVEFFGTDASGAAISWTRTINTQNTTDMKTTTVTRAAWAGEVHQATDGIDIFHYAPGQGVDAILGYDRGQDSLVLPTGAAAQVVNIAGTAALLVGPTNREGVVFDGIAYDPGLTLADLHVIFA